MSEPPDFADDLADDTVVLGGAPPPPPRSGPRLGRRGRWIAVGLAVVLVATVAWLNRPGQAGRGPIADDPFDQGARSRPLYPGATGRLLFTVPEQPTAAEVSGERLYALTLATGAVEAGPLLPAVATPEGFPPSAPDYPPDRSFLLGPPGTPAAGILAFLGDGPEVLGAPRFAYALDVGSPRLPEIPSPVGEARAMAWSPDGELLIARSQGGAVSVEGFRPNGPRRSVARIPADAEMRGTPFFVNGRLLVALDQVAGGSVRVVDPEVDPGRTLVRADVVLGAGPDGVLLQRFGTNGSPQDSQALDLLEWSPGRAPQRLEGFHPAEVLGWTADRLHYAALGRFRDRYGLWFVRWPNVPVFQMDALDTGGAVGPVAFSGNGAVAFYQKDLDLWVVEVGSEAARKVPLPDDVAREVPSGPVVWVP